MPPTAPEDAVGRAAGYLRDAERVLVLTGAGISADSGLPTYRGVGGLYNQGPTDDGLEIETILSGPMWQRRPELTWRYLRDLALGCEEAEPNRAHRVLALLEEHRTLLTVTQNVDGLHEVAGSRELVELHGNARRLRCEACGHRSLATSYRDMPEPPPCPDCGVRLRPDVVLFEELLPEGAITRYQRFLTGGMDLVLVIGTTAGFLYLMMPIRDAARAGVPVVEINPRPALPPGLATITLEMGAAVALDRIWAAWGYGASSG